MLKWYGHVVSMEGNRWPKRIIIWSPRGRRRVRPESKWGKELESLMKQDWLDIYTVLSGTSNMTSMGGVSLLFNERLKIQ